MGWTKEQLQAIETCGEDILVAAGAGSGKTTVLVSRILRQVLDSEPGYNIDDLLITTYTKAAAVELRSKIYNALEARLGSLEAGQEALAERICEQQVRLSRACVSTLHSFFLQVLTENMQESGIDGSFRLCEDAEGKELLEAAALRASELFSDAEPERYAALLDAYDQKYSDAGLMEFVINIVKCAINLPEPERRLHEFAEAYDDARVRDDFARTGWGKWLLFNVKLKTESALEIIKRLLALCEDNGFISYINPIAEDVANLERIVAALKDRDLSWQAAYAAFADFSFSGLGRPGKAEKAGYGPDSETIKKYVQGRRDAVKKELKKIPTDIFAGSPDAPEQDRLSSADNIKALCKLALLTLDCFRRSKSDLHLYDYSDMEHLCLKLMTDRTEDGKLVPSATALAYSRRFKEIYIDEYQDTNTIQELIVNAICAARPDGPHKFMVGDVKQSIYSFRNACPELFLEKYLRYSEPDAEEDGAPAAGGDGMFTGDGDKDVLTETGLARPGRLIRLTRNFRSRAEVIDAVNDVFSRIMNNETGGMPYGPDEYLYVGADYPVPEGGTEPYRTEIVEVDAGENDKTLVEAHEIMRRIKELIASGMQISGGEKNGPRPIRYSDICILMRSLKHAPKVVGYLRSAGIPIKSDDSKDKLFEHPEIRVATAFLHIIDNPRDDIPLVAVMKNVYGFGADDLLRIKLGAPGKDLDFYTRARRFVFAKRNKEVPEDVDARALTAAFLDRLESLRARAYTRPVAETLLECIGENGFADAVRLLRDGGVGYGNLMQLVNLATQFDAAGNGSFYDFVRRIEIYERGGSLASTPPAGGSENAVTLTTIHQSKGLEYNVVIIALAGSPRNSEDEKKKLLISKELGLGTVGYLPDTRQYYNTIMHEAVKRKLASQARAEEMRILYVAMTRAREKLIIVGQAGDFDGFTGKCRSRLNSAETSPMSFFVGNTDTYIALAGMAAVSKGQTSLALQPAKYADEFVEAGGGGSETAAVFGLPVMKKYSPPLVGPAEARPRVCPQKLSVSEIKRLAAAFTQDDADEEASGGTVAKLFGNKTVFERFNVTPEAEENVEAEATAEAEAKAGATAEAEAGAETEATVEAGATGAGTSAVDAGSAAANAVDTGSGTAATRPVRTPSAAGGKPRSGTDAARAGTLIHCCLEHIDFAKAAAHGVDRESAARYAGELIDSLCDRGFITEADKRVVPRPLLEQFIMSDFVRTLSQADYIGREIPFTLNFPSDELLNEPAFAGSVTAVQGVIDLVYRAGDTLVLVDYKSDAVPGGDFNTHSERYRLQLSVYARVLEREFGKRPDRIELYYLRYGKVFVPDPETLMFK